MNICISGPARELTEEEEVLIDFMLSRILKDEDKFISGGAIGVDACGTWVAYDTGHWVDLVVPATLPWDEGLSVYAQGIFPIEGDYMDRNDALAERGDVLVAFPETAEEELRSGTWATIRRFRKAGKPVIIIALDNA